MRCRCLLTALWIFIVCTLVSGQSMPSNTPDSTAAHSTPIGPDTGYVSGFEILSREKNPDALGKYPFQILNRVRTQWYSHMMQLQKSLTRNPGTTVIEFEVSRDGSPEKLKTIRSSMDGSLDDAASAAILSAAPFAPIPETFHEKVLKMRMHFGYDQPPGAAAPFCHGPDWGAHPAPYPLHYVRDGVRAPRPKYSPDPEYSEEARKGKYMSVVLIAGTVDPQGAFTDLCVVQAAGVGLDEKAMEAVKTWNFEPATLDGEPVAVRLNVEVSFRLF